MLEQMRTAELLSVDENKPSSNAFVREAQLIWKGVASAPEKILSSLDEENRAHTIQTALMSAGITFALAGLKRNPTLAWTVGRVVTPALLVPTLNDLTARAGNMREAMTDTWNSADNWKRNVEISKESIGQFAADFAISAVASGAAESFGRAYFAARTPGVNKLPELSKQGILSNWQKHMDGEIVPYKIHSPEGGGMRQVDLFIPQNAKLAGEAAAGKGTGLLVAQEGLKLDLGKLKNMEFPDSGLINLRADKSLDFITAYTHPQRFRVVPGVNLSAWRHETGLIKEGGWFAPKTGPIDVAFVTDVEKTLTNLFKTDRTVLAGYSSGAILSNEVAAKLGPTRVKGVISVASTVTGMEPAALPGQFRLIVRDHGDPTLLQTGGAGGKAKILANLGHSAVLQSVPENQVNYALNAYRAKGQGQGIAPSNQQFLSQKYDFGPTASIEHIALADGTPIVAQIKTNHGEHAWMIRDKKAPRMSAVTEAALPSTLRDHLDINVLVKDVVNGNLQKFQVPKS